MTSPKIPNFQITPKLIEECTLCITPVTVTCADSNECSWFFSIKSDWFMSSCETRVIFNQTWETKTQQKFEIFSKLGSFLSFISVFNSLSPQGYFFQKPIVDIKKNHCLNYSDVYKHQGLAVYIFCLIFWMQRFHYSVI